MGEIFTVNEGELEWASYETPGGPSPAPIRYKALTSADDDVPPVQYIEYAAGHTDPVHRHRRGEFFIVTTGEMWLDEQRTGAGGVAFIPAGTDYAVKAGPEGVRYFRVVTG